MNAKVVQYKERANNVTNSVRSQRESSPIPGVEIYDYQNGTDINVAEELVTHGLAEYVQFGDLEKSSVLKIGDEKKADESVTVEKPALVNDIAQAEVIKEESPEPIKIEIEPPSPEYKPEEFKEKSHYLPVIEEKSESREPTPEVTTKREEKAKVPAEPPVNNNQKPEVPQNGKFDMPGSSMNGSHKKSPKNKSDATNDFISGERSVSGQGDSQFGGKNKKINKKKFKGQDWNEMLNE